MHHPSRRSDMSDMGRKQMETQMQIRNNAQQLNAMWSDLNAWEDEIKAKDRKLLDGEEAESSTGFFDLMDEPILNDVNPEVMGEEELQEHAKHVSKTFVDENAEVLAYQQAKKDGKESRIKPKTYQEYNKWDAFDVDAQLKALDERERKEKEAERKAKALEARKKASQKRNAKKTKKEEALELKDEGNDAFKAGDLQEALDCYTLSLAADASVFQTYCNRAMVLLKLGRPADAQSDAEKVIKLNPKFTKGYMRRGAALEDQGKLEEALKDYQHVKTLEPFNKEARKMIKRVRVALGLEEEDLEETSDPYETVSVEAVDYGSDSDYEDAEAVRVEEEADAEAVRKVKAMEAREMPAHLKKKGALAMPKNATQFEQVWSDTLKKDMPGRAAYLRTITPAGLSSLLKAGVEADLFSSLLETSNGFMLMEEALDMLVALSKTKRFDMNMMMASAADKQHASEIIESNAAIGDPAAAAVLRGLRQKYQVA